MINDETKKKLDMMGMHALVEALELQEKESLYKAMTFDERLNASVDHAYQIKYNEKVKGLIRRAHFRYPQASVEDIYYSKRELDRQIGSGYYQRYMLSDGKANESLAKVEGDEDYPNTRILDTYSLEFLDLPNQYSEKDLKKAIISNMKDFILEIGKDFTYVGEEYRVQVGNEDFYIDLLFYNRALSCLVAFELKIDKFRRRRK